MAVPKINLNITSNAGYIKNNLIGIVEQLKKVQTEAGKKTVLNIEFKQIERLEKISKDIVSALGGLKDKAQEVKRIFDDIHSPMEDISKGAAEATKEVTNLNKEIRKFANGEISNKDLGKLRKDWKEQLVPNADDIKNDYSRFKKIHEDFINSFNNKQIKVEDFPHMFTQYERARNILREAKQLKGLSRIEVPKGVNGFRKIFEAYQSKPDIKVTIDHSKIPSQVKEVEEELSPLKRPIQIPVIIDSESIKGSVKSLVGVMPTVVNELTKILTVPIIFTKGNIDKVIKEIEGTLNAIHKDEKGKSKNNNKINIQIDLKKLRASLKSVKKILDDFYNTKKYFNPKIVLDVSDFNKKLTNLRKRLSTLQNGKGTTVKLKVSLIEANKSVKEFENKIKNGGLPLDKTVQIKADNSQLIKTVNESLAELNKLKDITVHINSNVKDVISKEKAQKAVNSDISLDNDITSNSNRNNVLLMDSAKKTNKGKTNNPISLVGLTAIQKWAVQNRGWDRSWFTKHHLNDNDVERLIKQEHDIEAMAAIEKLKDNKRRDTGLVKEKFDEERIYQAANDYETKVRSAIAKMQYDQKAQEQAKQAKELNKLEQQHNEEVARGNQLMEYGAMITQKQYDAHKKLLEDTRTKHKNLGGDESKLAQSDVLTLGTNAAEVNQANAIKNAMSWQGMFFRGADEKVNYLTSSLNTLYTQLNRSPGNKGVKRYVELTEAELKKARKEAEAVQKALDRTNPSRFRQEMGRHFRYIGRAFGFYESYDMLNEAGRTIMDIGEAMANLRTVMPQLHYLEKEEGSGYEDEFEKLRPKSEKKANERMIEQQRRMVQIASDYGNKIDETIESARLWGRMYKDQDTVNLLTAQSAKLAVADNFSVEESTKAVEAAMFQFGMTAHSTAEALAYSNRIIDVYTKLSHNAGVTAQDLAAAVERSGSVAHQAGMEFEFLTALIAQATRSTALSGLTNTSPFMLETA